MATFNIIFHGAFGFYRRETNTLVSLPDVAAHKKAYGTWADVWDEKNPGEVTQFAKGKSYFIPRGKVESGRKKPEFSDGGIPLFNGPRRFKKAKSGFFCQLFIPNPVGSVASFRFSGYDQKIFDRLPREESHLRELRKLAHVHVFSYQMKGTPELREVDTLDTWNPPADDEGVAVWKAASAKGDVNFHVFSEPAELVSRDHGGVLHVSHHNALKDVIDLWDGMKTKVKLAPAVFRPKEEQDDPFQSFGLRSRNIPGMGAHDLRSLWEMFPRTGTVGGGSCSSGGC